MRCKIVAQTGGQTCHIFSVSRPDGKYPTGDHWAVFVYPHETAGSLKFRAHQDIASHFKRNGPDYYRAVAQEFFTIQRDFIPEYHYHGRFDKENNFIEIDKEVEKSWKVANASSRFGL